MQAPLQTDAPGLEVPPDPASSTSRSKKLLVGSVAVLGASAIAVTPIAPDVSEAQQRTVALAAATVPVVTDDPAVVYQNLFESAFANFTELGGILGENPFPILGQLLENQTGYAEQIIGGIVGVPDAFDNFWNGNNGQVRLENAMAAFQNGDFAQAYDELNRFQIYSMTALSPLASFLFSADPGRGGPGRYGIPEQIALNVADVVGTVFHQSSVVNGSIKSLWGPFIGANFEIALAAESLVQAVQDGDPQAAFTTLVNTPGTVLNAVLNGYVDPTCTEDCETFPGLINALGPVGDIFVRLPASIAEALKPNPYPEEEEEAQQRADEGPAAVTAGVGRSAITVQVADATESAESTEEGATETSETTEDGTGTPADDAEGDETLVTPEDDGTSETGAGAGQADAKSDTKQSKRSNLREASKAFSERITGAVKRGSDNAKAGVSGGAKQSGASTSDSGSDSGAKPTKRSGSSSDSE